ncbi:MAG: histidine--tRNA ligase [Alphaproteobacteria bacterium]|nr:MAG: histidine--tRNA ligase [Alphaproteobacteria bacterium]
MSIKGTIDWTGNDYQLRQKILNAFHDFMYIRGFEMIEPSILERYELFSRSVGESSDIMQKELFFAVSKMKQNLDIVLRPEYTTSIIRTLVEHGHVHDKKIAYAGKVFRHDRPQKERYREFTQLGCEVFGDDPFIDIEVILYAVEFLKKYSHNIKVKINSLGSPGVLEKYKDIVSDFFKQHDIADENSKDISPIRLIDKMSPEEKVSYNLPKILDYISNDDKQRFNLVCNELQKLNVDFSIDPYLVRGLDYYNQTVFEIEKTDSNNAILGGGRYHGLVKRLGGQDVSGIGWSVGLERILSLMEYAPNEKIYAIVSINEHSYALKVANTLQKELSNADLKFIRTMLIFESNMKRAMKKVGNINPDKIIFCGQEEKNNESISVKDCVTQLQNEYVLKDINKIL